MLILFCPPLYIYLWFKKTLSFRSVDPFTTIQGQMESADDDAK
jgi:hypothetical protein